MISQFITIASIAFTINNAAVDPYKQSLKYEEVHVTDHHDFVSEKDTPPSPIMNTNPHIVDSRRRCNYKGNDKRGYYMRGESNLCCARQHADII